MIIRDAAKDASQGLSETLGYKPEFTVLFLPSFFNMSTKNAASKAMFPNGRLSKDGPKHIGYVPSAAGYAYRLGQCDSLGLTPDECENIDSSLVLVIEYEKDYLYLHIVGVYSKWAEFPPIEKKFAKEFGEQSGNTLRDVGSL